MFDHRDHNFCLFFRFTAVRDNYGNDSTNCVQVYVTCNLYNFNVIVRHRVSRWHRKKWLHDTVIAISHHMTHWITVHKAKTIFVLSTVFCTVVSISGKIGITHVVFRRNNRWRVRVMSSMFCFCDCFDVQSNPSSNHKNVTTKVWQRNLSTQQDLNYSQKVSRWHLIFEGDLLYLFWIVFVFVLSLALQPLVNYGLLHSSLIIRQFFSRPIVARSRVTSSILSLPSSIPSFYLHKISYSRQS